MQVINGDDEDKNIITSRYSLVIASAKESQTAESEEICRLRKMQDEQKPLSTAVEEIRSNKVKILQDGRRRRIEKATKVNRIFSSHPFQISS